MTDQPLLHKYLITLTSRYSVGESSSGTQEYAQDYLTIEDSGTLDQWYAWLQDMRVVKVEQVLLDRVAVPDAPSYSYNLKDLGRRESVLLVVANIVSIRRAVT